MIATDIFSCEPWLTIITGHYGVGKTNLSLNIARDLRGIAPHVTLVDLDIVNPYFRSTDNRAFLDANDVRILGPVYGASNLDTPSLSPGISEAIIDAAADWAVLVDVGGDPDGARALGRFAGTIAGRTHRLLHVVNLRRPETATVEDNLELLRAVETTSGLAVTGIIGNTHLKEFSTAADIVAATAATQAIADAAGIPLVAIVVPRTLAVDVETILVQSSTVPVYPVDIIVATPWEEWATSVGAFGNLQAR